MGLHKPYDREFFLIGGNVMTSGRSLNLAKGQFGIFDVKKTNKDGASAVSSFKGLPADQIFELRLGKSNLPVTRSQSNKSFSSFPFSLNDVVAVNVSAPERTEQSVDEVVLGYNGIDASTAISFDKGDTKKIIVNLRGEAISLLGYTDRGVDVPVWMDSEGCYPVDPNNCIDCDACAAEEPKDIVMAAIEVLKNHQLRGGTLVSDYVDITPVKSCTTAEDPALVEVPYDFYTLEVCDTGDEEALALVQAQFPDNTVIRIARNGSTSTYQTLVPNAGGAPADYDQTIASIIKGCEDCPAGYTATGNTGVLYAVTIEDDGADVLAGTIDTLPGYVTGEKADGQIGGTGFYTAVLDNELTQAEFDAFVAANATATLKVVGTLEEVCENATVTSIAWVVGDQCNVASRTFQLTLPDTECGDNRLAELQAFYPDLSVTVEQTTTVTLTGTSGTANVVIDGTNYLATYNVAGLTETADDFVTTHAAAILAAEGYVVTASNGVLTMVRQSADGAGTIAVSNLSGDLAGSGTVSDSTGCSGRYQAVVDTNLVCDECDPIFEDSFRAEAPGVYELRNWELVAPTTEESGCLMGIKIKGKVFEVHPDECLRDEIGFSDSSVMVKASGGYLTEVREGIGQVVDEPFAMEYRSRYARRTHMGGNLFDFEDRNRVFFTGEGRHVGDNVAKLFKGEESHLDASKQYVSYGVTIRRPGHSQSFSGRGDSTVTYNIYAEVGRHEAVENIVNSLATSAGLSPVQAFAKS
jgi:hypothetical protein